VAGWGFDALDLPAATPYIDVDVPQLPLRPGVYRWTFALYDNGNTAMGGRLVEQWIAMPELRLGGTLYGHAQDASAGWLNVPAQIRVSAAPGTSMASAVPSASAPVA
jgi:hypothetical protein